MSNAPSDGKFNQFYNDLVATKANVGRANVNIFIDSQGTTHAGDSNGTPIQATVVNYTMYTYGADFMPSSNSEVGYLRIVFKGNSKLEIKNTTDPVYWYSFEGDSEIKPLQ